LFSTLNNLYALTLRQADEAPEVVARLLGLLRFVVEQGHAPWVGLRTELHLLRNYLALQQLRYGSRLRLELAVGELPASGRIAPLPLPLLPLLENAFKHGSAEQVGLARIRLELGVERGWFTCRITNTKNAGLALASSAGIGLRNARHRLRCCRSYYTRPSSTCGCRAYLASSQRGPFSGKY
jgi:LytS/YehU family sensor histidine kinase